METQINNQQKDYSEIFADNRREWSDSVIELSEKVKDFDSLSELESIIYGKRQAAVEHYHHLSSILARKAIEYNKKYDSAYDKTKTARIPNTPNYLYSTDAAIKSHIENIFSEDKRLINELQSQVDFFAETIKTIDGIIYGIANRIRIEEIKRNFK